MRENKTWIKLFSVYMLNVFINMIFFIMYRREDSLLMKKSVYWILRLITEGSIIIYMIKNWKKDDYIEEKKKMGIRKFLKYFFISVFLGFILIPIKNIPFIVFNSDIMIKRDLFTFKYPNVETIFNLNFDIVRSIVYFPIF